MIFNSVEEFTQAVIAGRNEIDIQDYIDETFEKGGLDRLDKLQKELIKTFNINPPLNQNQIYELEKTIYMIERTINKNRGTDSFQSIIDFAKIKGNTTSKNIPVCLSDMQLDNTMKIPLKFFAACLEHGYNEYTNITFLFEIIKQEIKKRFRYDNDGNKHIFNNFGVVKYYISCALFIDQFFTEKNGWSQNLVFKEKYQLVDLMDIFSQSSKIISNQVNQKKATDICNSIIDTLNQHYNIIFDYEQQNIYYSCFDYENDFMLCLSASADLCEIFQTYISIKQIVDSGDIHKIYASDDSNFPLIPNECGLAARRLYDFITTNDIDYLAKMFLRGGFHLEYFTKALDYDIIKSQNSLYEQLSDAYIWLQEIVVWSKTKKFSYPIIKNTEVTKSKISPSKQHNKTKNENDFFMLLSNDFDKEDVEIRLKEHSKKGKYIQLVNNSYCLVDKDVNGKKISIRLLSYFFGLLFKNCLINKDMKFKFPENFLNDTFGNKNWRKAYYRANDKLPTGSNDVIKEIEEIEKKIKKVDPNAKS